MIDISKLFRLKSTSDWSHAASFRFLVLALFLLIYHLFLFVIWSLWVIPWWLLILIRIKNLSCVKSLIEWQLLSTISSLWHLFLFDCNPLLTSFPWSPLFLINTCISTSAHFLIDFECFLLLCFGELSLDQVIADLLSFLLYVVLAHAHKSLKLTVSLKKADTFCNAIIPCLCTLLLFEWLECLMYLFSSLSTILCNFLTSLLWWLVPYLLGSQLKGIDLFLKIFVDMFSVDNVSTTFLFPQRPFSLVQVKLYLLTLAI